MGYFNDDQILSAVVFVCCEHCCPPPVTHTQTLLTPSCRLFALPLDVETGAKRSQDTLLGYFNDEFTKQKMVCVVLPSAKH